jgi:hypothetical protein
MTEETPSGEKTATGEVSELQGRCTRQNVLIVVLKPKYLSNLILTDLFIAENVFLNTGNPEKTDTEPELSSGLQVIGTFPGVALQEQQHEVRFASLKRTHTFLTNIWA